MKGSAEKYKREKVAPVFKTRAAAGVASIQCNGKPANSGFLLLSVLTAPA